LFDGILFTSLLLCASALKASSWSEEITARLEIVGSDGLILENPLTGPFEELETVALPWSIGRLNAGCTDSADIAVLSRSREENVQHGLLAERDRKVAQKSVCAHIFGRGELFKRSAGLILTLKFENEPHAHADVSAALGLLALNLLCEAFLQFGKIDWFLKKTTSTK
jgi:hypothetical protein